MTRPSASGAQENWAQRDRRPQRGGRDLARSTPPTARRAIACQVEGLRPDGLHRPPRGAPHGPVRPVRGGRRPPGAGGRGPDDHRRDRARASGRSSAAASAASTPSSSRRLIAHERGPDRVSPLFIPMVIANMAAAQVSMELGLQGPAVVHLDRLRVGQPRPRRRDRGHPRRPGRRDARRGHRVRASPGRASPRSTRCARSPRATTTRRAPAAPSTRAATASSWARPARSWCSRASSTPRRAAPSRSARCSGTA